ncbi:MAG: substrate-binding domain-containing protein [Lachnospiraceae bacterium]|nr:substrate-binding domain-containing protein [Lachnospiraceae bacterium]
MKKRNMMAMLLVLAMEASLLAGCGGKKEETAPKETAGNETRAEETKAEETKGETEETGDAGETAPAETPAEGAAGEGLTFKDPIPVPDEITTYGPDGNTAAWYTELALTPEELTQVRSMDLKACFELINASEWDNANLIGFQDACEAMNIEIVGQGCCDLDPITQKTNMESFAALNPDIVSCQPQDLDVCAPTFDPLWQNGVKLTFMSNVPTGYTAGKEYVGAITDSIIDMGIDSAEMMADAIGGEGEILAITVADVNYVCNTRDQAFLDTIAEKYPDIDVVEVGGFSSASEAGQITSALVTKHPNVKGIFVSYSAPCIDVLQTVKSLARTDIKIVTMDLDSTCALDMAQGGNIVGIACDMPYAMGYGRALMAAYGCIGKECPGYVTSPSFKVTRDNLLEGYQTSLGIEAPAEVQEALAE